MKNSAIHQALLLRSCSRLIDMAAKHHVLIMRTGPIVPARTQASGASPHFGSALWKLLPMGQRHDHHEYHQADRS